MSETDQPSLSNPQPLTFLACAIAIAITVGIGLHLPMWGYLPAERVWDGALWALVSSAFVHVAPWHLVFNVYWLWRFGGAVERRLGSFKFLVFVVGAAFVSSAFQLALSGETGIGASGIIYGLFGFMWRRKETVPRFAEILGPDTASFFFIWLVACLVATQAGFVRIGNAAHFSGLLFGVLVAESQGGRLRRRLAASATAFLGVVSLLAAHANPWSVRWLEHQAIKMHRAGEYEIAAIAYERSLSFGADSAWAFYNLALTYHQLRDTTHYAAALRSLRAAAPADADSLELRLRGATR